MQSEMIKVPDLRGLVSDLEKLDPELYLPSDISLKDLMKIHSLMLRGYFTGLTHESA